MKLLIFSICCVSVFSAAGAITVKDPEGDAKFKTSPLPAFDLRSVTFEAYTENHLLITYEGYGPMAAPGNIYSWFATWIDLDNKAATGEKSGDFGADLILGTESTRGGPWTGEANTRAPVGKQAPITLVKTWTDGNKAMSLYQSELFTMYPVFRAIAFSHHDGGFVDEIRGGSMDRIQVFRRGLAPKPITDLINDRVPMEGGEREWKDISGQFSVTAKLKEAGSKEVILELPDGSEKAVPVSRLSDDDKAYLNRLRSAEGQKIADTGQPESPSTEASIPADSPVATEPEQEKTPLEEFYAAVFSEDALGKQKWVINAIDIAARLVPDSIKPAYGFPGALLLGFVVAGLSMLWFVIRTFKDSIWKGILIILLNTVSGYFLPFEVIRICFLISVASSDWKYYILPFLLHLFGMFLMYGSFLLVIPGMLPG